MSSSRTVRKLQQVVSPVPADIDIANSVEPVHISDIAKDLNLTPNYYDLYGKYKAKVTNGLSGIHEFVFSHTWTLEFNCLK